MAEIAVCVVQWLLIGGMALLGIKGFFDTFLRIK